MHLLVPYPPKVALSKLINSLKGVSSRCLRAEYTDRINHIDIDSEFWSRSYFAGSCGGAPLTVIRRRTSKARSGLRHVAFHPWPCVGMARGNQGNGSRVPPYGNLPTATASGTREQDTR